MILNTVTQSKLAAFYTTSKLCNPSRKARQSARNLLRLCEQSVNLSHPLVPPPPPITMNMFGVSVNQRRVTKLCTYYSGSMYIHITHECFCRRLGPYLPPWTQNLQAPQHKYFWQIEGKFLTSGQLCLSWLSHCTKEDGCFRSREHNHRPYTADRLILQQGIASNFRTTLSKSTVIHALLD